MLGESKLFLLPPTVIDDIFDDTLMIHWMDIKP